MKEKHLHNGHRQRMKARFATSEPNTFADHEMLEMLLYYALPRRDTNELAHVLIEQFGSLSNVLEVDAERLISFTGISDSTAVFLRILGEVAKRYAISKFDPQDKSPVFDTPEKIVAFLAPRFFGLTVERAYVLLFDNSMHLLDCFHAGDGSVMRLGLSMRRIAERALTKNASAMIIAHNHPGGLALASADDRAFTIQLQEAMKLIDLPVLEHYVFGDRGYTTIINRNTVEAGVGQAASPLAEVLQRNLRGDSNGQNRKEEQK